MGGIGQLAPGIEAIWKGSVTDGAGAAQSGAGVVARGEEDRGGARGAVDGHGKYQGKIAEFRRKA